jgi:hypothetical protein
MSKVNHESVDENDEEGSEWTLETTSLGTNEDGNAQGNEGNSTNALKEVCHNHFMMGHAT